ncbi:MAG: response regulator [Mongoliitalea sp.]
MNKELKILLVEDNEGDIVLTKEAFGTTTINHTIEVVTTGLQALDFLFRRNEFETKSLPDLILMDINIPHLNGHEVLKKIKQDQLLRYIPVVMLSTSSSEKDIKLAYENYASYFLTKPIDLDDFYEMVNNIAHTWGKLVQLVKN